MGKWHPQGVGIMGEGDHTYLRANSPDVVAEVIDGEAVLINFDTGSYYSLDGAGAAIWQILAEGASAEGVVKRLEARYESQRDDIRETAMALIAELKGEGLIVETETEPQPGRMSDPPTSKIPFEAPSLNKFTDMQEMLLLDPIHDVGETGWPYPNADQGDGPEGARAQ